MLNTKNGYEMTILVVLVEYCVQALSYTYSLKSFTQNNYSLHLYSALKIFQNTFTGFILITLKVLSSSL